MVSQLKGLQTNHFITHLIDILLEEDVGNNGGGGGNGNKKSLVVGNNSKSGFVVGCGGGSSICSVDDWTNTSGENSVTKLLNLGTVSIFCPQKLC